MIYFYLLLIWEVLALISICRVNSSKGFQDWDYKETFILIAIVTFITIGNRIVNVLDMRILLVVLMFITTLIVLKILNKR